MSRVAYVNGAYVPHEHASIHIEDRGFQFADSVYEVVYVYKGKLIDAVPHLDRMRYSLTELKIQAPMKQGPLLLIIKEMIKRNHLSTGLIYIQVSRGSARRDFPYPKNCKPTLVMTARRMVPFNPAQTLKGIRVMSLDDPRWARCDIKTTALLGAAMSKQTALDQGYDDAWMIDADDFVTEGTSNNAWIMPEEGILQTRPASHAILNGITRRSIMKLAAEKTLTVIEKPFTLAEAYTAKAAFISSASACVKPVISINDRPIGDDRVQDLTRDIAIMYHHFLETHTESTAQ